MRPLPATSAVLGRALRRLSDDYLAVHGHRVLAVEAFTDPARHTGACYAAANFAQVGEALGYGRCAAALPILSAPFDRPLLTREEAHVIDVNALPLSGGGGPACRRRWSRLPTRAPAAASRIASPRSWQ